MRDPAELYEVRPGYHLTGPVMLVVLDGFVDAGSVGKQVSETLFDTFDAEEIATFDIDRLVDYRARRPIMTFVEDAYTEYEPPKLALYLMYDTEGTPFLLLHGPEPFREWETFAQAVRNLVERFSVTLVVNTHGIPMAVPHTRPTTVTPHATRPDLVAAHVPWVGRVQVPASAVALVEFRMGQWGHDSLGYAVHVPSYLAQSEYPRAAITALEYVNDATGLALPTSPLQESAESADAEIEEQVAASEEVQRVVANLEQQYDDIMSARQSADGSETLLAGSSAGLPSADELGDELERFLAEQERGDG